MLEQFHDLERILDAGELKNTRIAIPLLDVSLAWFGDCSLQNVSFQLTSLGSRARSDTNLDDDFLRKRRLHILGKILRLLRNQHMHYQYDPARFFHKHCGQYKSLRGIDSLGLETFVPFCIDLQPMQLLRHIRHSWK